MIEEMQLRRFSERTIESYVRAVGQLAGWCWKSPDQVSDEELRANFHFRLKSGSGTERQDVALMHRLHGRVRSLEHGA